MSALPPAMRLVAITPGNDGLDLPAAVQAVVSAGPLAVMVREKDLNVRELFDLAVVLRNITTEAGALLLINGSVEVALAVKADGVHLGGDALPPEAARALVPETMLLGFSAHRESDLRRAVEAGCDYSMISPVFPPNSKEHSLPPLGTEKLAELCHESPLPLIALGGITPGNARGCLDAGAAGVAAIGGFFGGDDPAANAQAFREAVFGSAAP